MDVGEDTLSCRDLTTLGIINHACADMDIYKERRGVRQVAHARIVGHHGKNCTVVLKDCRLPKRRVLKLNLDFIFTLYGNESWCNGSPDDDVARINGVLHERIGSGR